MDPKTVTPAPDSDLQERMRKATAVPVVKPVDLFTAKLVCHHTPIPHVYVEAKPDPLNAKGVVETLKFIVGHEACMGAKCALWNGEDLECYDVTKAKSAKATARILDMIDGHARMSAGK